MKKIDRLKQFGLWRTLRCGAAVMVNACLYAKFRFDPWHIKGTYWCRPYKKALVDLINDLSPECVLEIGCGLADILSRVKARDKFGVDCDCKVIRAAKFVHGSRVNLYTAENDLPSLEKIDVLVLINWTHEINPSLLKDIIDKYINRVKYLLVDAIDLDAPSCYKHRHDFSFLNNKADCISTTRVGEEPRNFLVYRVKNGS